jgi:branched-chain amino acid transport system substrate-binding protein
MTKRFVLGLFLALTLGLAVSACGGGGEEAAPTEAAPAETAPEETGAAETGAEAAPAEEAPAASGALDVNAILSADLSACEPAPEGDPLIIGYAADLSEVGGFVDVPGSEAAEFMADLINCAGGVNGTPVEVIIEDIQGDPEVTQRAAQDLLDAGAQVILGPPFADFGSPLLQVTKGEVPVLFVSSTEPLLPDIENLSFLTTTDDIVQATTGAEFALDQGYQTAVTFSAPGPYFGTNPETFTEVFTAGGGEVIADYTYAPFEDTDFSTQVNELAGLPEVPDVLFTSMPMPQIATLIGQIEGAGIQIPDQMAVLGTDAFDATRIIDAPDAAEGVYYSTHAFPGEGTPMKAFLDKFEAEKGRPLETVSFGALAADAVLVASDAFIRAGSPDPLAIGEAVKETDGLEVVTGTVGYVGTNGVPNKPVYIHQILDGEVTLAEVRGGS